MVLVLRIVTNTLDVPEAVKLSMVKLVGEAVAVVIKLKLPVVAVNSPNVRYGDASVVLVIAKA